MKKGNYDFKEMDWLETFVGWIPRLKSERRGIFDGQQLIVYKDGSSERYFDAVLHLGSYGHEDNLLEIMGTFVDAEDGVKGYLTGGEIASMIIKDLTEASE